MAGGIVGGFSPWFDLVLAARVAEGLAAGVLQPIPAIVILHAFSAGERGKAMGIFGFGVVLAPALGPSVGGILVEAFGWRSIFFVVTPFCLLAMAMAQRYLPIGAPGGAPISKSGGRLDVVGLGLIAVAVLALLNGMVAPARRDARRSAWPCSPAASSRRSASSSTSGAARKPLMALSLFGASRLRDGRHGRLHLRHGAVRLDLPGAGVHAGGAAPAAVAGGRGAAAGRPGARGDDPDRRPLRRPHRRQPHGERRPGAARRVVLPDARRRHGDLARAASRCGRWSAGSAWA